LRSIELAKLSVAFVLRNRETNYSLFNNSRIFELLNEVEMFLSGVLMIGKSKNAVNTWAKTFGLVESQELELVVAPVCYWVNANFIFEEFSFEMC